MKKRDMHGAFFAELADGARTSLKAPIRMDAPGVAGRTSREVLDICWQAHANEWDQGGDVRWDSLDRDQQEAEFFVYLLRQWRDSIIARNVNLANAMMVCIHEILGRPDAFAISYTDAGTEVSVNAIEKFDGPDAQDRMRAFIDGLDGDLSPVDLGKGSTPR